MTEIFLHDQNFSMSGGPPTLVLSSCEFQSAEERQEHRTGSVFFGLLAEKVFWCYFVIKFTFGTGELQWEITNIWKGRH